MPYKFALGDILKDVVTGYTGVVMGRTEYLTGCNHYGLLKRKLKTDGKPEDYEWFDETRLIRTGRTIQAEMKERVKEKRYGSGPEQNAPDM